MGIVAHVDAGKTSLTERLLHAAGIIDHVGRVDDGTTQTDSMDLERRRGITIRSAVVSFTLGDLPVNLIDTPGHSDFIAEVERALSVLDGAVLVLSAVEGVQAQTRLLMRTLTRLRIPTLLFVNKIDRVGARYESLLDDIERLLTPNALLLTAVNDLGTRSATVTTRWQPPASPALSPSAPTSSPSPAPASASSLTPPAAPASASTLTPPAASSLPPTPPSHPLASPLFPQLGEFLAERNDVFLRRYLDDDLRFGDCEDELRRQVAAGLAHPVYFGSAMTGIGVPELISGIRSWLPQASSSADEPLQAKVFKVERGPAGQKLASARIIAGTLTARTYVDVHPADGPPYQARPTAIDRYDAGTRRTVNSAEAGQIVVLRGLKDIRIGDQLGVPSTAVGQLFARPTLETVVTAHDRGKLFQALTQLAEQDPLIQVHQAERITVRLYGEVQKEVIASLLESEYGLDVTFSQTTPIYLERLNGTGTAFREIGAPGNLYAAGLGFRVSPHDEGVCYHLEVELGGLPRAFHTAIEETVRQTLHQGLYGWEIPNIRVDLTHTAYFSPVTTASDFRRLTPPVLLEAIAAAGTTVLEPINHFDLEIPADSLARVLALLAENQGTLDSTALTPTTAHLTGTLPATTTHTFESHLPTHTHGEALLTTTATTHHPTTPPYPTRLNGRP